METWEQQEERNRRIGWIIAIFLHAVMLFLFFFITAWEPPQPPIEKYGINLNYGTTETGSGEEQTEQKPAEQQDQEQQPEETEQTEQQPEPEQTEQTQEPASQPDQAESYEKSSPHTVEEKEEKEEKEKEEPEEEKKEEEEKEKKEEKDPRYQYPGNNEGGGSSEGDDKDASGDKGKREGEINESNIYEGQNTGKSGNARLEISGWTWVSPPRVKDNSDETGKVVIKFRIDREGEIVSVEVVEKTVSASVAQVYKREIEKTSFRKLNRHLDVQPSFEGKVTFNIRAR